MSGVWRIPMCPQQNLVLLLLSFLSFNAWATLTWVKILNILPALTMRLLKHDVKHRVKVQTRGCPSVFRPMWKWTVNGQECDQRRLGLGFSLRYTRGPDVPLPARAHLSALRLPLNGTLALDHLLFLHAWVALGLRGKNVDRLSPLFSRALWSLKCDCCWIVAAFPWRFLTWKAHWALRFIPWPVIQD